MAETFKQYDTANIATGAGSTIYTVPSTPATTTIIIGLRITNTGSGVINVRATAGGTDIIGLDTPIPVGSSLMALGGEKIVMDTATDTLVVISDTASSCDVYCSLLEIT